MDSVRTTQLTKVMGYQNNEWRLIYWRNYVCCVYDEEFYVYAHWYIEDSCYIVKECLFKYSRGYSCLLHTTGTLNKTRAHPLKCCCDFWRLRILLVERVKTQPEYWCVLSRVETLISCVKLPRPEAAWRIVHVAWRWLSIVREEITACRLLLA